MTDRTRRTSSFARALALTLAAPIGASLAAQGTPAPGVFVSTGWLAEQLDRKAADVVVLHVGQTRHDYEAAHLPGARFVWAQSLARSTPDASVELPPLAQLDSVLEAAGVSDRSRVVLYGTGGTSTGVARAFMTLEYAGLAGRVSILDGGLTAWRQEGRQVSAGATPAVARGSLTLRPRPEVLADADWVRRNAGRPEVAVLDARTPNFYSGASDGGMPRPGHIPAALNIPFTSLTTGQDGKMKDSASLRALFDAAGVRAGQEVVTYCHIGLQGSLLYAAARQLGHPARLYDGSFEEWSHHTTFPVVAAEKK